MMGNSTSFKKGQINNPKGRGKGVVNKTTKLCTELKALAASKYEEFFTKLWENIEADQSWAYSIYVKDLLPRNIYMPAIMNPKAIDSDARLQALVEALPSFGALTRGEVLHELQVLSKMKLEGQIVGGETLGEVLDDQAFDQLHDVIRRSQERKANVK